VTRSRRQTERRLAGRSGVHHPLSPMIQLGLLNPSKKEGKGLRPGCCQKNEVHLIDVLYPVLEKKQKRGESEHSKLCNPGCSALTFEHVVSRLARHIGRQLHLPRFTLYGTTRV